MITRQPNRHNDGGRGDARLDGSVRSSCFNPDGRCVVFTQYSADVGACHHDLIPLMALLEYLMLISTTAAALLLSGRHALCDLGPVHQEKTLLGLVCVSTCHFLPGHTIQELESSVEGWTDDLASLFLLRDSLEGVVSTDDITVLQERLRLLQCQWEEVCHQVQSHSSHQLSFFPFLVLKKAT